MAAVLKRAADRDAEQELRGGNLAPGAAHLRDWKIVFPSDVEQYFSENLGGEAAVNALCGSLSRQPAFTSLRVAESKRDEAIELLAKKLCCVPEKHSTLRDCVIIKSTPCALPSRAIATKHALQTWMAILHYFRRWIHLHSATLLMRRL